MIQKLLIATNNKGKLKDVPQEKRTASYKCVMAVCDAEGNIHTCEGKLEGSVALTPIGTNGFGYDPVFYVPHLNATIAQLTQEQKSAISHRGKALEKAIKVIKSL